VLVTYDIKPTCNMDMWFKNRTEAAQAVIKANPGAPR
jgi:hypothetical protein